jgi:nucleotide-binding universal stress UspA family protein
MTTSTIDTSEEDAMGRIVVGVDGSPASVTALRWAAAEARCAGGELVAVHAYLAPIAYVGTEENIARIDPELHEDRAKRLAGFVAEVGADLDGLEVSEVLHPGRAVDGLLAASEGAALLVLGDRGAGGFEGLLLGSAAEHAARHAGCPVVIVPHGTSSEVERLVVGVDGSPGAARALAWAVAEAARRSATLEVVAVLRPYDAPGPFGGRFMQLASPGSTARFRHAAEQHVAQAVASIDADVTVVPRVLEGHPAQSLAEHAAEDLLVVGRRGREGFPGMLLGSIGRQVLHHAIGPVVVVPA